jgi:hypothetical protein
LSIELGSLDAKLLCNVGCFLTLPIELRNQLRTISVGPLEDSSAIGIVGIISDAFLCIVC